VLVPTLGALDFTFFVFMKREDQFKRFLAIFTIKLITRHGDLRKAPCQLGFYLTVYAREVSVSRMVVMGIDEVLCN
jgi:hypothetical protein